MKQGLSTGGTPLLVLPLPESVAESAYQNVIEAFGLAGLSSEDRIKALLALPIEDLWQKAPPSAPMMPCVDNDTVPGIPDFATVSSQEDKPNFLLPGRKWCKALMLGDSKLDVSSCGRRKAAKANNI